ncbi:MAG TPA: hypothetical protein VN370_04820, partial [Desulfitobacteriaceae bacterium]|nr:hypothetical protein [Desulfitobacteriaceae bacterium]
VHMDRTFRGLLAGMAAGLIMNLWNLADFYLLKITQIRFLDWAAVLITWSKPADSLATIFSFTIQLLWDGLLGILFAHLLVSITSRGIIIKSAYFSLMCWFIFIIIVNLFRVPFLSGVQSVPGAISNVFAVILWGISLGFTLKRLDRPA